MDRNTRDLQIYPDLDFMRPLLLVAKITAQEGRRSPDDCGIMAATGKQRHLHGILMVSDVAAIQVALCSCPKDSQWLQQPAAAWLKHSPDDELALCGKLRIFQDVDRAHSRSCTGT